MRIVALPRQNFALRYAAGTGAERPREGANRLTRTFVIYYKGNAFCLDYDTISRWQGL